MFPSTRTIDPGLNNRCLESRRINIEHVLTGSKVILNSDSIRGEGTVVGRRMHYCHGRRGLCRNEICFEIYRMASLRLILLYFVET